MPGRNCLVLAVLGILPLRSPAPEPAARYNESPVTDTDRSHWAFRPPARPQLPQVKSSSWVKTPVDSFIVSRLEAAHLSAPAPVEKRALLRRVTADLIGLPPTVAEQDAFLKDDRPDAYERWVERLLASPHYGERWAQHWLDVVRYAESNGYEADGERPHAWRYRDYVVDAFNNDVPFDRFVTEQLAGDLLATDKDIRAHAQLWVATGMHRCGPVHLVGGNTDPEVNRQEVLTEMVQGVGAAFLGLTVNCARCHDHKFDPISQGDYYRLEAFFAAAQPREVDFSTPEERAAHQKKIVDLMAQITPIKNKVAALDAPYSARLRERKRAGLEPRFKAALAVEAKKRNAEQQQLAKDAETLLKVSWDEILAAMSPKDRAERDSLRARQHALEAELPMPPAQAWAIINNGQVPPTYVLKRGDVKRKTAVVEPGMPRVLESATMNWRSRSPGVVAVTGALPISVKASRLNLARWLTSPGHPLTARVFVNRLWQHHFGRGLVATPNDFGLRGEPPTHPELLDWLATEFVQSGWKVKHMHRLMVLSNTYRMASNVRPTQEALNADPENKLLWRMNRRRLDSEALRDSILAAAGTLNREVGGPMVRVPLEPEVYDQIFTEGEPEGLWPVTPDARQHTRRSLYLFSKRNVRLPMLEAFDQPDRLSPCAERAASTFAPQALILMNGPFAQRQSRAMAARLLADSRGDLDAAVDQAYRRCFARLPRPNERRLARGFLSQQAEAARGRLLARLPVGVPADLPANTDPAAGTALADFCLALLNSSEFLYVP